MLIFPSISTCSGPQLSHTHMVWWVSDYPTHTGCGGFPIIPHTHGVVGFRLSHTHMVWWVSDYPTHTWCGGFPIIPYIWRALHTLDRRWRREEIFPQGHIRPGEGICLVQESIEAVISNCSQELGEQPYWENCWNRLTERTPGTGLVKELLEQNY